MKEGSSQLIFIVVKYRSKDVYGATIETITHHKQARLGISYVLTEGIRLLPAVLRSSG